MNEEQILEMLEHRETANNRLSTFLKRICGI